LTADCTTTPGGVEAASFWTGKAQAGEVTTTTLGDRFRVEDEEEEVAAITACVDVTNEGSGEASGGIKTKWLKWERKPL